MTTFLPAEKGTPIRMPATANLMVDSADRNTSVNTLANDFQITKPQSILNGFFTRIATTELVLEYRTPNISSILGNNTLTIDLSGDAPGAGTHTQTYTANGFFTAEELIDWVAACLTNAGSNLTPPVTWAASAIPAGNPGGPGAQLAPSATVYAQLSGPIANALSIATGALDLYGPAPTDAQLAIYPLFVDLRPYRYLDFVSAQLTYNQDLKDTATNTFNRDVLARWYMAYDNPPTLDAYGFPILMGYTPFVLRRIFSPPKQIRWDPIQPIGNISFQVYTNTGSLAPFNFNTQWLMTLQVSES